MLEEKCFICGSRIGRGMHPSLGPQERLEKLVSVTQSVAHSSTIICDTLSRILNETVMEDESICKICFNLLSDIDYHLKEAQVRFFGFLKSFLSKKKCTLQLKFLDDFFFIYCNCNLCVCRFSKESFMALSGS